jgi:hypothetical protein
MKIEVVADRRLEFPCGQAIEVDFHGRDKLSWGKLVIANLAILKVGWAVHQDLLVCVEDKVEVDLPWGILVGWLVGHAGLFFDDRAFVVQGGRLVEALIRAASVTGVEFPCPRTIGTEVTDAHIVIYC